MGEKLIVEHFRIVKVTREKLKRTVRLIKGDPLTTVRLQIKHPEYDRLSSNCLYFIFVTSPSHRTLTYRLFVNEKISLYV